MRTPIVFAVVAFALVGCTNHIESTVTLNGTPMQFTACRNGNSQGFNGVEFSDPSGSRLRLQSTASGVTYAHYFPAGAPMAIELGACGPLTIGIQNSRVNNVQNVQGNATLQCATSGYALAGTVRFSNCH